MSGSENIVIIKKYANRRLYNTQTSMYVTLDDLAQMVKDGQEFEVVDAKTAKDITHQVLTQIIFDEESKGAALLPINFLRQLIRFYDNSLQSVVPHYLEMTMDVFTKNQENMRDNMEKVFGSFNPFAAMGGSLEEMQRRNMDMLRKSFGMFNPFIPQGDGDKEAKIDALTRQVETLNAEIEKLRKKG
ncbi:MAG: polyhydroxyalkanoate synthesis repressor PhaR [Proteobacteria bacterium]|nr:polyhydroxyalkanoate synthesis repressor PhaR [Pseudomonadota bacterium]